MFCVMVRHAPENDKDSPRGGNEWCRCWFHSQEFCLDDKEAMDVWEIVSHLVKSYQQVSSPSEGCARFVRRLSFDATPSVTCSCGACTDVTVSPVARI